jgi:hypothetical protein
MGQAQPRPSGDPYDCRQPNPGSWTAVRVGPPCVRADASASTGPCSTTGRFDADQETRAPSPASERGIREGPPTPALRGEHGVRGLPSFGKPARSTRGRLCRSPANEHQGIPWSGRGQQGELKCEANGLGAGCFANLPCESWYVAPGDGWMVLGPPRLLWKSRTNCVGSVDCQA